MEIKEWIITWFVDNSNVNEEDIRRHLDDNYFDEGFMDSFTFISFINEVEDEFGLKFANDQFEDISFSTVNGMAKIIEGLLK